MDLELFENRFKKRAKFDKYFHLCAGSLMLLMPLYLIYLHLFADWYKRKSANHPDAMPEWAIYLLMIFICVCGLLIIFLFPRKLGITSVSDTSPLEEKEKTIRKLEKHFEIEIIERENNYRYYRFELSSRNISFVDFFIDSDGYHYYLRNWKNGFADPFGQMKKANLRIEEFLKETQHRD